MHALTGPRVLAAGWAALRKVARSVPPALGAVGVLAAAPTAVVAVTGRDDFAGALIAASIIVGAGVGYAVDDPAAATLAASPTSLAVRRGLRGAVVAAMLACAWAVAVLLARGFGEGGAPDLSRLAAVLAAAGGLSLALATRARTDVAVSAGFSAAAGALLAMVVVASLATRWRFLPTFEPGPTYGRWWWIAAAALASAAWSSRDPARRRLGA